MGAGMLLLEEEGVDPIFAPEDSFQDGQSTLELYQAVLAGAGIELPDGVVLLD